MNKVQKIIMCSCPLIFLGCNLDQNGSDYNYTETVHNEYYYKQQNDPNYKLKVQDLDLNHDIETENIFCYSKAKTPQEKYKTIIKYLREDIPLECDDQDGLVGPSNCVVDSDSLDMASKEHSNDMAQNNLLSDSGSGTDTDITAKELGLNRGSTPQERAKSNGYEGNYIKEAVMVQDVGAGETIPDMIEKAMKSKSGFCSLVLDKRALHISVDYAKKGDKRYWTFMYGDDRQ